MAERIYIRGRKGGLEGLREKTFGVEGDLQELIADHPEVIDGEQIRPNDARRWILLAREKGIAETSDAGARWSLDHLIIDQDARPTLVEAKLRDNSDIHRKIVGQMLEYAAHASETWTVDELRRTFEESTRAQGREPDEVLAELLQEDEPDDEGFWDRVATNLAGKRLRLLFIADGIPDRLARVVEFLNGQMPRIEVLAVEIKRFPRQLGRDIGRDIRSARDRARGEGCSSRFRWEDRDAYTRVVPGRLRERRASRGSDTTAGCGGERWGEPSLGKISCHRGCRVFALGGTTGQGCLAMRTGRPADMEELDTRHHLRDARS